MHSHLSKNSPDFIIIAGPNGSGKSTISAELLKSHNITAYDWDKEFYKIWRNFSFDLSIIDGVRDTTNNQFLNHLEESFNANNHVAFETNFHSDQVLRHVEKAKTFGYNTKLVFLLVDSILKLYRKSSIQGNVRAWT